MTDRLPAPVRRITDTFKSFTPGQKAVTIFAVFAIIVGGYFFATWAAKPSYSILFNNLSTKDASAIVESLQKSNTSYELANDGQTILVPRDQVNALRLQLSGEGLPNDEGTGYSLLDQQGITTSDFMQHANYQRALEGELAKTIQSIDGVEAATVHLVMPQKDVFADSATKPTASVLVASKSTSPLTGDQVQAIVHLVASSVEGLDPTQVTVAGADGKILSTGGGAAIATGGDSGSDAQTVEFQNRMNASLQSMLDRLVGPGHSVVTTTADLDFDQTETRKKEYSSDPSLPSVSETTSSETYTGSGSGNGGVLGPDNIQVPNGAGSNGQYANKNETRQNALNEVEEVRRKAPGSIRRLNVAVLLDSTTAAAVDPTQVQQLVSSAAGIDPTRGDTIVVSAMPFDTSAQQAAQSELAAAAAADKQDKQLTLIKSGALAFVVLILIFLAWRASRRAKRRQELSAEERAHLEAMQAALDAQRQAELEAAEAMHGLGMIESAPTPEERDEAREERHREIEHMVKEKPDEMAQLLRSWMSIDSPHG